MTAVQHREVGDVVEWTIEGRGTMQGLIVHVGDALESEQTDAFMGRPIGSGWSEFGALCRIRCLDPGCVCDPTHQADQIERGRLTEWWRGWLHTVSESQLRTPADDPEVGLW